MQRTIKLPAAAPGRAANAPAGIAAVRVRIGWVQIGMLLSALGALPLARNVDNDFWWHLRTGRLIFETGLPDGDPYSWTARGEPWLTHEWLSEVTIYVVQSAFGYAGNVALFGAIAVGALVVACALARQYGTGTRPLALLMIVAVMTMTNFVTVRPQQFTWLLFAVFLYIIARRYDGTRGPVWALPPLMALWSNLHLGFVYGLLLLATWVAAAALDAVRGQQSSLRTALLISGACLAATLLNPHGFDVLIHPVRYLWEGQADRAMVYEWQRPDISQARHWAIFLSAGLLAAALAVRTRPRPFLLLVSVWVIALTLEAFRNAPFAAIVLAPVCGAAFAGRWRWAHASQDSDVRMPLPVATALVAATGIAIGPVLMIGTGLSAGSPSERGYPSDAAAFVLERHPDARLFNDYNSGGFLVYKLYPQMPVFVDGRGDVYGNERLRDYGVVEGGVPGWDRILDDYGVDVVLISRHLPLANVIEGDPRWRRAFVDETDAVYTRADGMEGEETE